MLASILWYFTEEIPKELNIFVICLKKRSTHPYETSLVHLRVVSSLLVQQYLNERT